jgi:phytoene dehydrogenase-like protein
VAAGLIPVAPPLIAGIHTLADPTRAPEGCHTLWIETHVPSKAKGDAAQQLNDHQWSTAREPFAERIIDELSLYAPDVRSCILDYHAQTPEDLEASNANLVGGDIAGGSFTIDQQLVFRPVPGWFRHAMPIKHLYLGGASTHPGGGVHGAAGANAARVLLHDLKWQSLEESARSGAEHVVGWLRR